LELLSEAASAAEDFRLKHAYPSLSSRPTEDRPSAKLRVRVPSSYYYTALHHVKRIKVKTQGYHFGVLFCAVASGTVFIINLVVTIWASSAYRIAAGLGTIQDGGCSRTNNLATWLHLAINVLSTLLLGCSNFTMQCLSSPTRKDIDRAHSDNCWLDIGVQGTRNLRRISRPRLVLWCLIALSSIPLHLLYNSAVFTTLSAREYSTFIVNDNFLTGQSFNVSERISSYTAGSPFTSGGVNVLDSKSHSYNNTPQVVDHSIQSIAEYLQRTQKSLQRLENQACVDYYSVDFLSTRADVLLVTSEINQRDSYLFQSPIPSYLAHNSPRFQDDNPGYATYWMCDTWVAGTNCSRILQNNVTNPWRSNGYAIDYCLSQQVDEHCKVQFSVTVMVIVICCNFVKMIVMAFIAWKRPTEPLMTLGDAIASFLDEPDPTTRGNCLAAKDRFQESKDWSEVIIEWDPRPRHWLRATSSRRFVHCNLL